jgi:hypothetical protein
MSRQKKRTHKMVHYCIAPGCSKRVVAAGRCQSHLPRIVVEPRPLWTYENEKGEQELIAEQEKSSCGR